MEKLIYENEQLKEMTLNEKKELLNMIDNKINDLNEKLDKIYKMVDATEKLKDTYKKAGLKCDFIESPVSNELNNQMIELHKKWIGDLKNEKTELENLIQSEEAN